MKETVEKLEDMLEILPLDRKEITAIETAIKAVEKQVPKKIKFIYDNIVPRYNCPECGRIFWEKEHIGSYCGCCGQKLEVD